MHIRLLAILLLLPFLLLSAGCGNLIDLRRDIDELRTSLDRFSGTVESSGCADCSTIVVALEDFSGNKINAYRVLERPGDFELVALRGARYLFAFHDNNGDLEFQPDEPFGWQEVPQSVAQGTQGDGLKIWISTVSPLQPQPILLGHLALLRGASAGTVNDVQLGKLAALDESRFDRDMAGMGMWQPLRFLKEGYAGVYFLEPYSKHKVPVVFIHGINGSPRDFAALIARLDRRKFQPWVFYYPSGFHARALGDGLLGALSALQHLHDFDELHLVAHSMGGLVGRQYLDRCERAGSCAYLRSFTTIATPFGGHAAAQSGIDYSPVVMPAWRSMAPEGKFLKNLFARPLPQGVLHYLLFGYRNDQLIGAGSSDGVISLESQLRHEAQLEAVALRGFNEDHVSILGNPLLHADVNQILQSNTRDFVFSAQR